MRQQYGGYSNESYLVRVISKKKRLIDREEQRGRNQAQNSLYPNLLCMVHRETSKGMPPPNCSQSCSEHTWISLELHADGK